MSYSHNMGTAMRHLLSSLAIGVTLLGSSVASATPQRMTAEEFRCIEEAAPVYVHMAMAAGYSDPFDLGAFYTEAVERCLEGQGWAKRQAKAEADELYCSAVADAAMGSDPSDPNGHGTFDLCEDVVAERNAERNP